ncbi:o-succinylbenzoate synthase [Wansuia hejianensis]|uniref:o-succinylbenzoate synthase n=1 Tax=Wansuia hejianensis TaxID=2763667 RepID=A0A926F1C3_9FIRM|nr:o-succinylbenzoate synthase [Wansuia hejianensis]MBC8590094.1 o-succinylbenzoate synthase [Wansuia hejianensis]
MKIKENFLIDTIKIVEVNIPYDTPFQISGGVSYSRKSLIIEIHSGDVVAYGEAAPFESPFYSSETISTAKAILIEELIPRVVGVEIKSIEELNNILNKNIRGNNFAKAGIETGYWDLVAKKNNISLKSLIAYKLKELGTSEEYLKNKDYIYSGVSVGIPEDNSYETLKNMVKEYVEQGYTRVKIKIKPGWDVEALKHTRDVIGDEFILWPDANAAYSYEEGLNLLKEIDKFNCNFIEQPLDSNDILDHTKLMKKAKTPICFDESLKSSMIARQIVEIDGPKIWNIKIQRVGGLLEALKIYTIASHNNIEVWGGTMPESGIGGAAILALSTFEGFKYPACIEPSERWYGSGKDLKEIEMDKEGKIYYKEEIGIGEINSKNYNKYGTIIYEYKA